MKLWTNYACPPYHSFVALLLVRQPARVMNAFYLLNVLNRTR